MIVFCRLELFMTLGMRHREMGMHRKAAFYFRRAAMCEVKFKRWEEAHSLLVSIAPDYKLANLARFLVGKDVQVPDTKTGWCAPIQPALPPSLPPFLQAYA